MLCHLFKPITSYCVFAGDQVLEWNGRILQGATFKEVYNIILESKPEPQVELVVSRPIGWVYRITSLTPAMTKLWLSHVNPDSAKCRHGKCFKDTFTWNTFIYNRLAVWTQYVLRHPERPNTDTNPIIPWCSRVSWSWVSPWDIC